MLGLIVLRLRGRGRALLHAMLGVEAGRVVLLKVVLHERQVAGAPVPSVVKLKALAKVT